MKKYKIGEVIESERSHVAEKQTPDWAQENGDNKQEDRFVFTKIICTFFLI